VQAITTPLLDDLQAQAALADSLAGCSGILDELSDSLAGCSGILNDLEDLGLDALEDALKELAEALGIPFLGYEKVEEVFEDLMGGIGEMASKDIGEWGSVIGTTFTKIIPKLLITLLLEGGGDWQTLTDSFKEGLSKLFG